MLSAIHVGDFVVVISFLPWWWWKKQEWDRDRQELCTAMHMLGASSTKGRGFQRSAVLMLDFGQHLTSVSLGKVQELDGHSRHTNTALLQRSL